MPDTTIAIPVAVGATVMAVAKWLLGREVDRIDKHQEKTDSRLDTLEKTAVTREDLDRTEVRIVTAINSGITELRQATAAAHERIDRMRDK